MHPVSLLIEEEGVLISHLEVVWNILQYAGEKYKAYGLTGVFTYPAFRKQGMDYIMNNRTKIALLFLGNLLLLLGFFFLPWYIAPFNTHGHLLEGPSAWKLMTFPFVAQTVPQLGGFLIVTPFWLLAALIIFELGGEIWKLRRRQRISTSRLYKNVGQIGLLCIIIIFILLCLEFASFGWRSILISVSGPGFWSCLIGFLLIGVTRLPLLGRQRVSEI